MKNKTQIIIDAYRNLLGREPDDIGLKYFLDLLERNEIDENKLEMLIKNSQEYKMIHPVECGSISYTDQMRVEWDARSDFGFPFYQNHKKYFTDGYNSANIILGRKTRYPNYPLFDTMFCKKQLNSLRVLDIGSGLGRILVPMSELFKEAIGVEISPKMIQLSKSHIKRDNCKVLLNKGDDLSMFEDNYFDFCYSVLVFQHFPNKSIAQNYMKEISRVLKPSSFFRMWNDDTLPEQYIANNTWCGVKYSRRDIEDFCKNSNFNLVKEEGKGTTYYILTFKSKKI